MRLRQLRENRQFTLDDVRRSMDWSLSKLARIETGVVNISTNDLKVLLDFYEINDQAVRSEMLEYAKISRDRFWANDYRTLVSQAYLDFMGYERDAVRARQFHPLVVPGLLQTADYARAIIAGAAVHERTAAEIETRVHMRLRRQEQFFKREDPPALTVTLDEAAVRRSVGGKAVMRVQLEHLISVLHAPNVTLAIIPMTVEAHPGLTGPFCLLEFDSPEDHDVAYLENAPDDVSLVDEPVAVTSYKSRFESLQRIADNAADTERFLTDAHAALK